MNMPIVCSKDKYIDLHLHLDGSVTPEIAHRLAEMQGITLPDDDILEEQLSVQPDCSSLNDFLKCFELPVSLLQTKEALSECVYMVCTLLKEQGVIYAEIRFAPQLHCQRGLTQEDAVRAVLDGLERSSLSASVILCCMRGSGNEKENFETVEVAKKYLTNEGGVTAIDLAGAEALFPTKNYRELFARARKYGIPFTIHAGEADGADSIRAAVEFGAIRIGHGVRCFEDKALMEIVRKNGIAFEMCPTSNRQTHSVEDMSDYPLMAYLSAGIKVTINTDDPAIERTTIAEEYKYIQKLFGLDDKQKKQLLSNAVDAAFTSERVKSQLRRELGIAAEGVLDD